MVTPQEPIGFHNERSRDAMADAVLNTEKRIERGSRPSGRIRRAGKVPAVVYGLGTETLAITVSARELRTVLAGGANTLITLKVDGDEQLALARQVHRHAIRGEFIHVDFVRVRIDVAVAAEVALTLTGEPEGVRSGGLLEQLIFTLPIEAMPQNIPGSVEHDVGALDIGGQLRVGELALPTGVATTLDLETLVAQVVLPRVVVEPIEEEGVEGAEGEGESDSDDPTTSESSDATDDGGSGDSEG